MAAAFSRKIGITIPTNPTARGSSANKVIKATKEISGIMMTLLKADPIEVIQRNSTVGAAATRARRDKREFPVERRSRRSRRREGVRVREEDASGQGREEDQVEFSR